MSEEEILTHHIQMRLTARAPPDKGLQHKCLACGKKTLHPEAICSGCALTLLHFGAGTTQLSRQEFDVLLKLCPYIKKTPKSKGKTSNKTTNT